MKATPSALRSAAVPVLAAMALAGTAALFETAGAERLGGATERPAMPTLPAVEDVQRRIEQTLRDAGESRDPPDYAYGAYQRGYFLTAFAIALEQARRGDASAQTLLGELLARGLGVKRDYEEAAGWYQLAGEAGDKEALYALGRLHLEGLAVEQDEARAAELFEKAADRGHAVARRELAYLLLQGKGRERNAMLAAAHLTSAARAGDMDAQFALAGLFMEGVGVVQSEAEAARWFAEAARSGHVPAQIEYAILLFNGRGVSRDEAVAARWFRQAAQTGNPVAQIRLARLLADGRGVNQDPQQAAQWYLLARSTGLRDDHLEDWLLKLDSHVRRRAEAAAQSWLAGQPEDALPLSEEARRDGGPVDSSLQ